MGEEAFDETVLAADTGTLTIRGGYGRKEVWLGIHKGNDPEGTPDMGILLTPRQQKALAEAIEDLTFVAVQDRQERLAKALQIAIARLEEIATNHRVGSDLVATIALEHIDEIIEGDDHA